MSQDPELPQPPSPLDPGAPFFRRNDVLAAAGLIVIASALLAAVLIAGARGDVAGTPGPTDTPGTVSATPGTAAATQAPASATGGMAGVASLIPTPAGGDELAIAELARLSVTLLPEGRWPELYGSFVQSFRDRCGEEEFARVGEESASALGDQLPLVRYRGLNELTVSGDTARAVIVSDLTGTSESLIEASFERVDGQWLLAPAPGTEGCAAFNRISG